MNVVTPKILIIRLSSIGDILLTTPFIRQTRLKFPDSQLDYVIKKEYAELLEYNTNISNLIKFDPGDDSVTLKELKYSLIEKKYEYIFDLHNNFRSIYLRQGHHNANISKIKKNKITQFLFVKFNINKYTQTIPIAERYLNVGKKAGITDDGEELEIYWDKKTENSTLQILKTSGLKEDKSYFAIAPGAGFYTKRWPLDYYKIFIEETIKKHNCNIVILGNKQDQNEGNELNKIQNVIDLTGKLSLIQSAVVLSKCKALISNDTGLMHMATAVKVPVLAIFGSTVKEFGFFPYRAKSIVVENNHLQCRPCTHVGRNNCPKKHFDCMRSVTPSIVLENFNKLLIN